MRPGRYGFEAPANLVERKQKGPGDPEIGSVKAELALLFALGMPLDFYSRIEVALASISTIRLDSSGIRVLALNEAPRLAPPP